MVVAARGVGGDENGVDAVNESDLVVAVVQ